MTSKASRAGAAGMFMLAAAGALGAEKIALQHAPGDAAATEYGVLLFRPGYVRSFGPGPSPIDIGAPASSLTQVAAFTRGYPPVLGARTPGSGATLTFPSALQLPLKVWVLCVNANCDAPFSEAFRERMETFLFKANRLLERERSGLVLMKAGSGSGSDWISDQTGNAAKREQFKNFRTQGDLDDCSQDRLDLLTDQMKEPAAFNLYAVGRVDGLSNRGESCLERDLAVAGAATSWHTKLHEIGHNLGLLHFDENSDTDETTENLMHPASSDRRFLTEGQTFRISFDKQTALYHVFKALLPPQWPFRDCTNPDTGCPPEKTRIWEDQD